MNHRIYWIFNFFKLEIIDSVFFAIYVSDEIQEIIFEIYLW